MRLGKVFNLPASKPTLPKAIKHLSAPNWNNLTPKAAFLSHIHIFSHPYTCVSMSRMYNRKCT